MTEKAKIPNGFGKGHLGAQQRKMLGIMINNNGCWPPHYTLRFNDRKIMRTLMDRKLVVEEQFPGDLKLYRVNEEVLYGVSKVR